MGNLFSVGGPQELYEFRKLNGVEQDFDIPEKIEYRRVTDKKYLITFGVFIILLFPFLIYTLIYTDFRRLLHGYDNCGNICGFPNQKDSRWDCTGIDMTDQKYILFQRGDSFDPDLSKRECVSSCPNDYTAIFTTCIPMQTKHKNNELNYDELGPFLKEVGQSIKQAWWGIVLSTIIAIVLAFIMMSLFRYAVDFMVWFILLGSIGLLALLAGLLWYLYFTAQKQAYTTRRDGTKGLAIIAAVPTIIVIILICVITCMIKRVKLIIQLFKEASKSIFAIPFLVLLPIYTSLALTVVFLIFFTLTVSMGVAGKLTEVIPGNLVYQEDVGMMIAIGYNLFMYIWFSEFIAGCQYFIIAGSVSAWFFAKNKEYLGSPMWKATNILFRFHTGTIAIGSLVITLMAIVRQLIKSLASGEKTRWILDCCLQNIEEFIRFLSKNAYIQTAMHGQPFFKSGKRAAKLLVSNAVNVISINSIGDFVLVVAQLLLLVISITISVFICKATGAKHFWAPAIISAIIAALIANCFFALFESAIDCIFICFCEDTTLNDGMARPYQMSKGLMQFIEDSKAIMPKKV